MSRDFPPERDWCVVVYLIGRSPLQTIESVSGKADKVIIAQLLARLNALKKKKKKLSQKLKRHSEK